ncbi:TPA: hypothetical protein QDA82_001055 [Burkholderia vietnamiensis]|nr:hypothetical protein [Burkholderia vietnamiensis]
MSVDATGAERANLALLYWRERSPLEQRTIAYAAYHGDAAALRIVAAIITEIEPPLMPPVSWLRDPDQRIDWERRCEAYALALKGLRRNKPGIRSRIRRFLRSI